MSAYRELMFLYGVAKELVDEDMQPSNAGADAGVKDMPELDFADPNDSEEVTSGFPSTRMSPLSTTGLAGLEDFDFGAGDSKPPQSTGGQKQNFGAKANATKPVGGGRIGLDIDLDSDSDDAWSRSGFR
jgi:hypothetical protein